MDKYLLKNRYGERIVVFHGIDLNGNTKYNSRFVSKDYFENFIKYILTHFNVISLSDYYNKKFKPNTLNIAITFDDGYLNNYTYALPILKKYKVPASFYITTIHNLKDYLWADYLDLVSYHTSKRDLLFKGDVYRKNSKNEFMHNDTSLKSKCKSLRYEELIELYELFQEEWTEIAQETEDYWKLMDNHQLKEIANDSLFNVGAHGKTHANLEILEIEEAISELEESKEYLESVCDINIKEFAFPFGYYNNSLVEQCKKMGYEKILLVDYHDVSDTNDESLKNRFVINPHISMKHQLACLLKGSYF